MQEDAPPVAYLPATQSVHSEAPGSEYVPAGQPVHVAVTAAVDLAGPYVPAAQGEPVHVEAPAVADSEVTRVSRGTYNTHQTV